MKSGIIPIVEKTSKVFGTFLAGSFLLLSVACSDSDPVEDVVQTYSVDGTITKSDGGVAFGASVKLQNATDGSDVGQTTTNVTGMYVFTNVSAGAYQVVVAFEGYETATISGVEVRSGDAGGKDAVLQKIVAPTYAVSGLITKSDGGAATGATVKMLKAADNTLVGQATTVDAVGAYTLAAIPSGAYKIFVTLDGYEAATLSEITVSGADITGKDIVLQKKNMDPNAIYIMYNGDVATINNPYEASGVSITAQQANVSVVSAFDRQIEYVITGNTGNGSLTIQSATNIRLTLDGVQIASATLPAIQVTSDIATEITLDATNALIDGANTKNATLISKGGFIFGGYGTLQISGMAKHAISSSRDIRVESGNITIPEAASDGFHSEGFTMNGGSLVITASGDAIDAGGGTVNINGGNISVVSSADDIKGIKGDDNLTINGGAIVMTVSGAQSKGLSSKKDIAINNGNITIETSGSTVLETSGSGYDPSYCTAVKADGTISVSGGMITINSLKTANGGKGLSADGDIIITGGSINITTAGDGAVYTNENGVTDSYSSACIKSDENISLLAGTITCSSSGSGGKGVSADGTLTIGRINASNASLVLNVGTTGQRFFVSNDTGAGRPDGGWINDNADYANPKAIKSEGNLTVNSGTIRVSGTQNGGEGLESKSTLTVNGGNIDISAYDDCINAAAHIQINGGTIYCASSGNDAVDSNGTLTIAGGLIVGAGARGAEGGFDCDNSTFKITGGIVVGAGGATSVPTANVCTQPSVKFNVSAGGAIGVKNSADESVLLYQIPSYSGGSAGGFGGGNGITVLLSSPQFKQGSSYTLLYGGSISGGTTVNGYNVGGTYSGGNVTRSFTITSMLTTVQ